MEPIPKANVLLVDDQPNNLFALEAVLGGMGLNLVRARSGEETLLRILDHEFAVILMDVQMPGMDGFETAATIRQRDRSKHTPIIFLTAYQSTEGQVFQGYALGAVDYLSKPIVPAVLRSKVGVFVELFRKTEQVRIQAEELSRSQRREHERELAEERQRWEVCRLREEATRDKEVAESLAQKAEELTRTIAERTQAEELSRRRASQQAIVAGLGQRALEGAELDPLLDEAVALVARDLDVACCGILEVRDDGSLMIRAGVGWDEGVVGQGAEGAGTATAFTPPPDEPVIFEDLASETRFAVPALLRDHGIVSGLSVVIPGQDRPFGALGAFTRTNRVFAKDDIHFLQAVAHVLAAAIRRMHDEQELAAIRDELASQLADMTRLHALGARLSNSLELPAVLEEVLAAVTGLQGAERGVLMLHDRAHDTMVAAARVGFAPGQLDVEPATPGLRASDGASAVVCGSIVSEDVEPAPVAAPHLPAAWLEGCQAVCTTPLLTGGGQLIGTIATYFPQPHRPADREIRMVELYARQAAEFIDNARLYREIQEADRRKDEFLAMLAHELRNPLAPLLNSLHLLGLGADDDSTAEQIRGVAERQARHLARLVDDLLDVSRISNGKIQLRRGPLDLRAAISRALETVRPLVESRHHELTTSLPPDPVPLLADAARLEQILANLLNNAAKYTEPGGRIALEVARDGDDAVMRIRDSGIGIAPELLPRVFDLFTQEDRSLDRSQGGLGIGLTLVRRLVELHGGSVTATSAGVGQGSEFVVRLPAGTSPEAGENRGDDDKANGTSGPGHRRSRRVLVVDDNIDGARVLARLLRAGGHETLVAHDGPAALEEARAHPPDVVLLDIGLPGMDGYQVARRLRELDGMDRALLVALTGYGRDEDRRRSMEAGFDHHLVKPVDPGSLKELLTRDRPPVASSLEGGQVVR